MRIILRADSGFCRHRMLRWCECHSVSYIVGLARNQRLQRLIEADFAKVDQRFQATGEKQRHFIDLRYSAKSRGRRRAVIAKLEITTQGRNPRFIVTNLNGDAQQLYDQPVARWRTASRSSNWVCSPIAPALISGEPISSACCYPVWPMC